MPGYRLQLETLNKQKEDLEKVNIAPTVKYDKIIGDKINDLRRTLVDDIQAELREIDLEKHTRIVELNKKLKELNEEIDKAKEKGIDERFFYEDKEKLDKEYFGIMADYEEKATPLNKRLSDTVTALEDGTYEGYTDEEREYIKEINAQRLIEDKKKEALSSFISERARSYRDHETEVARMIREFNAKEGEKDEKTLRADIKIKEDTLQAELDKRFYQLSRSLASGTYEGYTAEEAKRLKATFDEETFEKEFQEQVAKEKAEEKSDSISKNNSKG
ncbi:MAG: hypothetical protein MJ072_05390, partial [Clostridia bacterium]|nr:hypothetical protein [Clostridia bacterium]